MLYSDELLALRDQREGETVEEYSEYLRSMGLRVQDQDEALAELIETARGGDLEAVKSLLFRTCAYLHSPTETIPEPIRQFLLDAFERILLRGPWRKPWKGRLRPERNARDLKNFFRQQFGAEAFGDANAAFLIKRPQKGPAPAVQRKVEETYARDVVYLLDIEGAEESAAVAKTARNWDVSLDTVKRAWDALKIDPAFRKRCKRHNDRYNDPELAACLGMNGPLRRSFRDGKRKESVKRGPLAKEEAERYALELQGRGYTPRVENGNAGFFVVWEED